MGSSTLPADKRTPSEKGGAQDRSWVYASLLAVALVLVAATASSAYSGILHIGFLLDDFSHLGYAYRACHGDWAPLLHTFTSNWTGTTDNLTSYRPLISVSFCLDYLFWQFNAFGYHLTNVVMFAICSLLTSLIAYDLCITYAKPTRVVVALASGLLFASYPLHPEAVAWIIGRVDVQCGMFYLASLYLYMLWRRSDKTPWLLASLLAFAGSLPSKEMAATLPAVVTILELLLPATQLGWTKLSLRKRAAILATFWGLLFVFAVLRTLAIGTLVGGYGGGGLKAFIRSLKNFADRDTWCKVLFALNEEMPAQPELIRNAFICWWVLAALALARLTEARWYWRIIAGLLLWLAVSELPTFQIWHVFPNLSGSRLLFIPSSPLCIALSMVALPTYNISRKLSGKFFSVALSIAGGLTVLFLCTLWYAALQINLMPWSIAGASMDTLTTQVRRIGSDLDKGKLALLLDLPQDVSGSGMVGRPEFLQKLLGPPLYSVDLNQRIATAERPIPGSHDCTNPHMLADMLKEPALHSVFLWNQREKMYCNWRSPAGAKSFVWNGDIKAPGSNICWLQCEQLDPFAVQALSLTLPDTGAGKPAIQLVWRSTNQPKSWIDYSEGPTAEHLGNALIFVPSRYRSWLFNGPIKQIGLKLPADWTACAGKITGGSDAAFLPSLKLTRGTIRTPAEKLKDRWLMIVKPADKIEAVYDASTISGAAKAELIATKSGVPLSDTATDALPGKAEILATVELNQLAGTCPVPPAALSQPGVHQIAITALDSQGKVVGLLSESCSFSVVEQK